MSEHFLSLKTDNNKDCYVNSINFSATSSIKRKKLKKNNIC